MQNDKFYKPTTTFPLCCLDLAYMFVQRNRHHFSLFIPSFFGTILHHDCPTEKFHISILLLSNPPLHRFVSFHFVILARIIVSLANRGLHNFIWYNCIIKFFFLPEETKFQFYYKIQNDSSVSNSYPYWYIDVSIRQSQ